MIKSGNHFFIFRRYPLEYCLVFILFLKHVCIGLGLNIWVFWCIQSKIFLIQSKVHINIFHKVRHINASLFDKKQR